MTDLESGAVVLVDFTFTDRQQSKRRPALVVSNSLNNRKSRDVIVMKITSKEPRRWGVTVTNEDLVIGSLACISFVQVDAIYALEKTIICEVIGMLSEEKMQEIHNQIAELFDLKPNVP